MRFTPLLLLLAVSARGEDLTVLNDKVAGGPPKQMMSRYLTKLANEAFAKREAAYEKLKTPEQIKEYQQRMRKEFIARLGGFPKKTPLHAKVVGVINRDRYRIEKVIFESQPRHYVTTSFYLPTTDKGPYPGVVVPSGHSATGKAAGYNQQVCISLATHGIAALAYDPIGQGERSQILDDKGNARYRSTQEHTLVGAASIPLGRGTATFRIWDGIRAIDYLCSRKEIDPKKIGATGCSGGGTLSSYLMALDERVACAAPSCYLTTFKRLLETIGPQDAEQNIFGQIALGMDHADYVMMRAPKPTLILAATQDFFDIKGTWATFRESKRLYTRMGYPERVNLVETPTKHGYPAGQRVPMTRWMQRWLRGIDKPVTELDMKLASVDDLRCTPKGQTLLLPDARSVADLNHELNQQLAMQRKKLWQDRDKALGEVRRITGIQPLDKLPTPKITEGKNDSSRGYNLKKVTMTTSRITLPILLFTPASASGETVLYLHGQGKHVDARKGGPIEKLVKQGKNVVAMDLSGIGEIGSDTSGRWGGNWKDIFLAYLLGKSFVTMQAEDILAVAQALKLVKAGELHVIAKGGTGPAVLHAVALEPKLFASVTISGSLSSWSDLVKKPSMEGHLAHVVHGALRAYDLPDLVRSIEADKVKISVRP